MVSFLSRLMTSIVLLVYPTNETTNLKGTAKGLSMTKSPFKSALAPMVVPCIIAVAPIKPSPVLECLIVPLSCCA